MNDITHATGSGTGRRRFCMSIDGLKVLIMLEIAVCTDGSSAALAFTATGSSKLPMIRSAWAAPIG